MLIPKELKDYIILQTNISSIPKIKSYKIQIICPNCGLQRQSNAYDVLHKNTTICNSCSIKRKWRDPKYREKSIQTRNTKYYRTSMSKSVRTSDKYKKSRKIIEQAVRNYWKEVRGGYELHEVYDEWNLYRKIVYKITEINYRKYKDQINPNDLPRGRGQYHLDHKFSILEGFKNNILPYVISHPINLQMLTEKENISKDHNCDIDKETLMAEVGYLRGEYGYSKKI